MARLAINGGESVARPEWPLWPIACETTRRNIDEVLASGRWTLSAPSRGVPAFDQRFAKTFAAYTSSAHCVPTASGSTALSIALEACGVGAGDEVIVPGLSWVASSSAVMNVGAVPVLVDVDPSTFCLTPEAVATAITDRTRAVTVVHLYSALADLDALLRICSSAGVPLIEDCSQAHGAEYRGRAIGTLGSVGAFSMHGAKLLTSGEGGVVITDDADIARRAQHLRSDGRTISETTPPAGFMELIETGEVMGNNACMSEFHAAVLLAQLQKLDSENDQRRAAATYLTQGFEDIGIAVQSTDGGTTRRSYYRFALSLKDEVVERVSVGRFAEAVSAEIGIHVAPTHRPLNDNPLLRPETRRRLAMSATHLERLRPQQFDLPIAERVHRTTITFAHEALLAEPRHLDALHDAFAKVLSHVDELVER